jgi:hypothetical protein
MRNVILVLGLAWLGCASPAVQAEEIWTPVPNCGARAPAANDIISNSSLWQCAKSEFARSQSDYDSALRVFASHLPTGERAQLEARIGAWNEADQQTCTKHGSLDFGCAVVASDSRARILKDATVKCGGGPCHVKDLP